MMILLLSVVMRVDGSKQTRRHQGNASALIIRKAKFTQMDQ